MSQRAMSPFNYTFFSVLEKNPPYTVFICQVFKESDLGFGKTIKSVEASL